MDFETLFLGYPGNPSISIIDGIYDHDSSG